MKLNRMVAISALLTSISFGACGQRYSSVGGNQVVVKPAESKSTVAQPADPLLSHIHSVRVKKQSRPDKHILFRVTLTLQQGDQWNEFTFSSDDISTPHFGSEFSAKLCTDANCVSFETAPSKIAFDASIRCTSSDCNSALIQVRGLLAPFKDKIAVIEHQRMEDLTHNFVGSVFLRSKTLTAYRDAIDEHSVARKGTLEVTRVLGTPYESIEVYSTVTPLFYNAEFSPPLKPADDVTKNDAYFEKTFGAMIERDGNGKLVSQTISKIESYPNQNRGIAERAPGRVTISWKPYSGQLMVSLQDAWEFPNAEIDDGGTLQLGFTSERLVKPGLDSEASPEADPFTMF